MPHHRQPQLLFDVPMKAVVLATLILIAGLTTVHAQAPEQAPTQPAVEAAAEPASAESLGAPEAALDTAVTVRLAVAEAFASLPRAPGAIAEAMTQARPDGSLVWLAWTALLAGIALAVAVLARVLVGRWGAQRLSEMVWTGDNERARRVANVMARVALAWLADVAFAVAGIAIVLLLVPEPGPARQTTLILLFSALVYLLVRDLFKAIFSPDRPADRLLKVDDDTARQMFSQLMLIAIVGSALLGLGSWLAALNVDLAVAHLVRIASTALVGLAFFAYFVAHRHTITRLIRGQKPRPSLLRRMVASLWLFFAILYIVSTTLVRWGSIVLDQQGLIGPTLGPIIAAVAAFAAYGLIILVVDRRFEAHKQTLRSGSSDPSPAPTPLSEPAESDPVSEPVEPVTAWRIRWMALTDHLAGIGATVFGVGVLLLLWGSLDFGGATGRLFALAIVLFLTYAIYATLQTLIEGKIEEETPAGSDDDMEEGMGPGSSRLATLLPLLRNAVLIIAVAVAVMVFLASIGVDIAPLFAGAGVVGLAVGFGAQALIRDIFSGVFFLADDAFRRGEYIDVGGAMGSVEKISLRSFQLRHHNGPLHTIPFGEIKQLTNFSRDWVIMKLPLRIAYGTDVEKVRKLVKKLGQELAADPEVGPLFLQPLKSQGVVEMEDSAMIMRVKFMTKPGDQFVARRHVFTRIGELFEENGIRFAHREVTVRIADQDANGETIQEQAAAAGAARALQDAQAGR